MTTDKKKISFEQDQALARGRDVARSNQRRRVAANQAADKARAEREQRAAEQAAREREQRAGFDLGQRVTGRCRIFGTTRTGTVIEGPPAERGEGVWITDDDGNDWVLGRHTVEAVA